MKKQLALLIAGISLAVAAIAHPILFASNPKGEWIQLTDEPCALEQAKEAMTPEGLAEAKRAEAVIGGKHYEACYIIEGDAVGILFEDGDVGMFPKAIFSEKKIT